MLASATPSDLEENLSELSLLLNEEDWEEADRLTADLLLDAVAHSQTAMRQQGATQRQHPYLTTEAVAALPCQLLQAIDDRWQRASGGHFGFSAQLQIYANLLETVDFDPDLNNWSTPHPFFEDVGWLMLFALRPVGFLRFYNWLEFDLDAPKGHLPALWYWKIPRIASLQMGGFLTGQGGCFGDLARLDAMMLRLSRCHQIGG
ncbi:GUN4 domain-containing protein [Nodosilinea sp. LEGE 07298]|uniref:GUN4 domain-containing protein n=1 Tax=Nodosilinea sp. LEGE 07298 TaxID=2777970 RepID=UPI001880C38A|nr:GUN4 domain-containing protein [Nodosilinea sp. LEGE 07298]MBE9109719.1 GUN4 domain-containing protein [Nodosilinea sp. LEGE 07298]